MLYYYLVKYEKTVWVGLLGFLVWMAVWVWMSSQIMLSDAGQYQPPMSEVLQMQLQETVDSRISFGLLLVFIATARRFRKDWRQEPFDLV